MTPRPRPSIDARDPTTLEEWREAAAWAKLLLLVHDARLYGLLTGGPAVHVDRCVELLARAAAEHDIRPTDLEVEAALRALLEATR